MEQRFTNEDYARLIRGSGSRLDNVIKEWQVIESQHQRTPKSFEIEKGILNNIEKMSSEMASLQEALSINNELLKATNDLLLQITGFLSIFEAQSYFWTEEWQKAEREATRDIATGKVHTFEDVEQLIDFLHS